MPLLPIFHSDASPSFLLGSARPLEQKQDVRQQENISFLFVASRLFFKHPISLLTDGDVSPPLSLDVVADG